MAILRWESECLAILSGMATGNGNAWSKEKGQIYLTILRSLGEEAAKRAVQWAILNCEWRPEPAKLREIAANLYSPLPVVGELWREVWHKAITDRYQNPQWTHPVMADLVKTLGGWHYLRSVCWGDSDARFRDELQRRFERAYTERASSWWRAVADQLAMPAEERDPHYFPPRRRVFEPPALLPPDASQMAPPSDAVQERLRNLGAGRIGNGNGARKETKHGRE